MGTPPSWTLSRSPPSRSPPYSAKRSPALPLPLPLLFSCVAAVSISNLVGAGRRFRKRMPSFVLMQLSTNLRTSFTFRRLGVDLQSCTSCPLASISECRQRTRRMLLKKSVTRSRAMPWLRGIFALCKLIIFSAAVLFLTRAIAETGFDSRAVGRNRVEV